MQQRAAPFRIGVHLLAAAALLLLTACGTFPRSDAVPAGQAEQATIPGMTGIRFFADGDPAAFTAGASASLEREKAYIASTGQTGPLPPVNFLAISGGGENGAFGAGLIVGWTKAGTRPVFKAVTGISTGALIAPFAFLGPAYDDRLQAVYTTITGKDVLESRGIWGVFQDAMADNAPLRKTVAKYFDQSVLDAIAVESKKGRLLLIGTTDLDARRPVIWDIGRIAESNEPGRLKLVQDILVASAAIPGAFPPTMIDVELDGKRYQEMHVDGGASTQVFVYPPGLNLSKLGGKRERHLYVIRNARLDPDWAQVDRSTMTIAGRAISSLIQTQGIGDLYRIYLTTQRDGIDFNLAYIPKDFTQELKEPFETAYMVALFKVGYDMSAKGFPWVKAPPGFDAPPGDPIQPPLQN